ncbi:LOW QUALITY PROTEIN: F-box/WD repeat-containing protein 12 [Alosa alosa]|uniref:LOW QUALITY PROTEIN: F-box/WD repeat-containing protein 12 n=1 Tax=Alosa alosa TaxID=278164 RepID=UPI002015543C|nr:LOW QUALITY PROTEIN: F-box/WD repeat-containing protein 12 [Alosa alosa]
MGPLDLPLDCLILIFSYLHDEDLIIASYVCKAWHEAAETPWLWRKICLRRWGFCNIGNFLSDIGKQSWKSYYLRRALLELKMKTGRSGGDYTCQSLRGHNGKIIGVVYLAGINAVSEFWNQSSIVCSASTDGTVRAWDVQKATQLWSSPEQRPLCDIVADLQNNVVVTVDNTGTVKAWEGPTGGEVASFSTGSPKNTLYACSINDKPVIIVGSNNGALHTLTSPSLSKLSSHVVFDSFRLNLILSSPDKKWILTATKDCSEFSPKIFFSPSLSSGPEGEGPVSVSLPRSVCGVYSAAFLPSHSARVAVIHCSDLHRKKYLSVFNISMTKTKYDEEPSVQQTESFELDLSYTNILLQARDSNTLVVAAGNQISVYSVKGALMQRMEDHTQPIMSICVDNFRVVTASRDLSLRVLTWNHENEKGLSLESQYHLLGGSQTMSRGFTVVACDYISIVGSVEAVNGKDVLKAYSFNT